MQDKETEKYDKPAEAHFRPSGTVHGTNCPGQPVVIDVKAGQRYQIQSALLDLRAQES